MSLTLPLIGQHDLLSDSIKDSLRPMQTKMFNAFCSGDVGSFMGLTGEDFVTINADGSLMDKAAMETYVPQFKGATFEILEQSDRFYNNLAVSTGKAKFFMKSVPVSEVYFTQIWIYREAQWSYIGWQGTTTGTLKYYPQVMLLLGLLLLWGVWRIVARVMRRRSEA